MADNPADLLTGILLIVLAAALFAFIALAIWSSKMAAPEDFVVSSFHDRSMSEEDGKENSNHL